MLLIGRVLSGLSAGIFTGTATAAVVEAVPPERRDRAGGGGDDRQHRRTRRWDAVGGLLVQYAPHPLYLSFVVHIVLVVLAIVAVLLAPETSSAHCEHRLSAAVGTCRGTTDLRHRRNGRLRGLRRHGAVHRHRPVVRLGRDGRSQPCRRGRSGEFDIRRLGGRPTACRTVVAGARGGDRLRNPGARHGDSRCRALRFRRWRA